MIIQILIILLAIPTGFLIAWLARDELVDGRLWFEILIFFSFLLGIFFYTSGEAYITLTTSFIAIVSFISLLKGYDKTWVKKRI